MEAISIGSSVSFGSYIWRVLDIQSNRDLQVYCVPI